MIFSPLRKIDDIIASMITGEDRLTSGANSVSVSLNTLTNTNTTQPVISPKKAPLASTTSASVSSTDALLSTKPLPPSPRRSGQSTSLNLTEGRSSQVSNMSSANSGVEKLNLSAPIASPRAMSELEVRRERREREERRRKERKRSRRRMTKREER